ncbi:unnamed protein product, partial [Ectocarpus fasciculatus]
GQGTVSDHSRAFGFLLDSTTGTSLESRIHHCATVWEAWEKIRDWILPKSDDELYLLEQELETLVMRPDENPREYFSRFDATLNTLSAAGIQKPERDIVRIIIHQLPEKYNTEKFSTLSEPGLSRQRVEEIIQRSYSRRRANDLRAPKASAVSTPASASAASTTQQNPHALVVGGGMQGMRGGGGAGRQQGGPVFSSNRYGQQRQQPRQQHQSGYQQHQGRGGQQWAPQQYQGRGHQQWASQQQQGRGSQQWVPQRQGQVVQQGGSRGRFVPHQQMTHGGGNQLQSQQFGGNGNSSGA